MLPFTLLSPVPDPLSGKVADSVGISLRDRSLSVIIPAYNEAKRIGSSIARIREYLVASGSEFEIIVVDDGSTDATLNTIESLKPEIPQLSVISYGGNMGKGYAVRQGMLAAGGDLALLSDADLAAPIEEVAKLAAAVQDGFDVAVGSRALPGSILTYHQPLYREMGGRGLNLIIQLMAVPGIRDTQCGFKLFTRKAVKAIFPYCRVNGFAFDVEALYLAKKQGLKIKEVPIRWAHQEGSKVRPLSDGLQIALEASMIRFHSYKLGQSRDDS